jgi:hypothetical protein
LHNKTSASGDEEEPGEQIKNDAKSKKEEEEKKKEDEKNAKKKKEPEPEDPVLEEKRIQMIKA